MIEELAAQLGSDAVLNAPQDLSRYLRDQRALYEGRAAAVVLPRSVAQVATILAFCHEHRIGVVPQGGNTSYCGGATPDESGRQIVLALERLNRIRAVDALGSTLTVEAGCILADVQRAASAVDRLFPLSLGAEGSCQIGGNLSTNAGGTQVLRYGMMRDLVLGLEVVLADGRVLSNLAPLRKDNTGYAVSQLFLGAEGTLGVITAATLKLFPAPRASATAFIAVAGVAPAVELLAEVRRASGDRVSAFELIPRLAVALATRHIPDVSDPLPGDHEWFVLCELTSARADDPLEQMLQEALVAGIERGWVRDAIIAQSGRQAEALWRLREHIPEAQRRDGASLKHDISVPIGALPEFVRRASEWLAAQVPEGRVIAYGHLGDGNLHFNLNQAPGVEGRDLLARGPEVMRAMHDLAHELGGSFSAEHGIGRLKVGELERYAPPVELDLMRAIKHTLDPRGILNPGKVLRQE